MGSLGASRAVLVRLGVAVGVHWARLGTPEGVLESSWGYLGASWEDLGMVLGSLGSLLGVFWEFFWTIFCNCKSYKKIAKNLGKLMVSH